MSIYMVIVAITLLLGIIMPQKGQKRIYYIVIMTAILAFVCAFRYEHLTGDLRKYHASFMQYDEYGWFSEELLQGGRNFGFFMLNKLVNVMTGENFQALLIVIAVTIHIILAYVIYRYSPAPWMSFLTWNCMSLYIFGFSAIKQALAMAILMLAFVGIAEKRPGSFLLWTLLAGTIHVPALIFLPAYWLAQRRVDAITVIFYVLLGIALYVFKDQFVAFIRSFYYDADETMIFSGSVGGRFFMILGFTAFGLLFRGFSGGNFDKLFHIMAIAVILQMLSGYDNIFTRLTDYYFQFSVLYMPMIFYQEDRNRQHTLVRPIFLFNRRSLIVMAGVLSLFMIWFYWTYNINITIANQVDNYLDFRFMWDVQ